MHLCHVLLHLLFGNGNVGLEAIEHRGNYLLLRAAVAHEFVKCFHPPVAPVGHNTANRMQPIQHFSHAIQIAGPPLVVVAPVKDLGLDVVVAEIRDDVGRVNLMRERVCVDRAKHVNAVEAVSLYSLPCGLEQVVHPRRSQNERRIRHHLQYRIVDSGFTLLAEPGNGPFGERWVRLLFPKARQLDVARLVQSFQSAELLQVDLGILRDEKNPPQIDVPDVPVAALWRHGCEGLARAETS